MLSRYVHFLKARVHHHTSNLWRADTAERGHKPKLKDLEELAHPLFTIADDHTLNPSPLTLDTLSYLHLDHMGGPRALT